MNVILLWPKVENFVITIMFQASTSKFNGIVQLSSVKKTSKTFSRKQWMNEWSK